MSQRVSKETKNGIKQYIKGKQMRVLQKLKRISKTIYSFVNPIGDILNHLRLLTNRTAKELGIHPVIVRQLDDNTLDTCYELGLIITKVKNNEF